MCHLLNLVPPLFPFRMFSEVRICFHFEASACVDLRDSKDAVTVDYKLLVNGSVLLNELSCEPLELFVVGDAEVNELILVVAESLVFVVWCTFPVPVFFWCMDCCNKLAFRLQWFRGYYFPSFTASPFNQSNW